MLGSRTRGVKVETDSRRPTAPAVATGGGLGAAAQVAPTGDTDCELDSCGGRANGPDEDTPDEQLPVATGGVA
jgi:hypothetical protein